MIQRMKSIKRIAASVSSSISCSERVADWVLDGEYSGPTFLNSTLSFRPFDFKELAFFETPFWNANSESDSDCDSDWTKLSDGSTSTSMSTRLFFPCEPGILAPNWWWNSDNPTAMMLNATRKETFKGDTFMFIQMCWWVILWFSSMLVWFSETCSSWERQQLAIKMIWFYYYLWFRFNGSRHRYFLSTEATGSTGDRRYSAFWAHQS